MGYAYKVVEGKLFVTPIVYVCKQCPFKTTDKKAEQEHYHGTGHFLGTTTPVEKTEEWNGAKHGPLPSWIKVLFNCNDCRFSSEDDLCDEGHTERQPGKADFAPVCPDFKLLRDTSV